MIANRRLDAPRFVLLAIVMAAAAPTCGQESSPPDEETMWQFREAELAFHTETFTNVFRYRHAESEPCHADALACIEVVAHRMSGYTGQGALVGRGRQAGRRARKAGCDDPILYYAMAYLNEESEAWARAAVDAMVERNDPPHRRAYAALRLARLLDGEEEHEEETRRLFERCADDCRRGRRHRHLVAGERASARRHGRHVRQGVTG